LGQQLETGRRKSNIFPKAKSIPKYYFLLAGLGVFILSATFLFWPPSPPRPQLAPTKEILPPPPEKTFSGKIARGQTITSALRSHNLPPEIILSISQHLKPLVNLRKLKPGDSYEGRLTPEGRLVSFNFRTSPIDIYQLTVKPSGEWQAQKKEVPVDKYWVRISGEIQTNLFAAVEELKEQDQIVLDFADILAAEIDFHSDPQPGDRFQIIAEKYYTGETFVKYGRILYAAYQTESKTYQAIYFQGSGRSGGYYTSAGESVRKVFLRSPLQFTRISSAYSKKRRHPILGGVRPHYGIDYAAPEGSPVWAIGDGNVSFCGWNGGYGKQVVINHAQGYKSMYGHLSRFAPGIKKGKTVRQKQLIGYVGSTGLATGPHLDFRLLKHNSFRNPLKGISPRAAPLHPDQLAEFARVKESLLGWLNDSSPFQYWKVASLTSRDWDKIK